MVTGLIAEIANSYYELIALDNQLLLIRQNIEIQSNAYEVIKYQKRAARVTELAVKRFEAQLLQTTSMQYEVQQSIVETENRINFLIGRFPQPVLRTAIAFTDLKPAAVAYGIPSQLLENRTDVRQAEQELAAAKLNVQVARANFYPSLGIGANLGFSSFSVTNLLKTPESLMYFLGGDLLGPVVNRNGIKAMYNNANAQQIQALYKYEQTVLNAYIEVANQISNISNLQSSYELKEQQVAALTESISISNELFRYARADYMEVLLTQRDALESKFELIETKMKQMHAWVDVYRALGGGWN
jgi:outer membrane protein TolC